MPQLMRNNIADAGMALARAEPRTKLVNYRHAFHAGSFADVFKHAVLCRILHYLRGKPAAFRVIDTHAGAGLYDLTGAEASRGGEWHDGIERLLAARAARAGRRAAGALSRGDRRAQRARPAHGLSRLAGARARLAAPAGPADRLRARAEGGGRARRAICAATIASRRWTIDGWTALSAYVPPPERRGLVLVDPPFEEDGDFHRLSHGLGLAHRKWATGIYALWYPIKGRGEPDALAKRLRRLGIGKILRAELIVSPLSDPTRLNGSGLILVNPPWTLGRRAFRAVAGAGRRPRTRRTRAVSRSTGWPAKASRPPADACASFHAEPSWCVVPWIGSDVPPPLRGGRRSD